MISILTSGVDRTYRRADCIAVLPPRPLARGGRALTAATAMVIFLPLVAPFLDPPPAEKCARTAISICWSNFCPTRRSIWSTMLD